MYFNADSLLNKINELEIMIGEENPLVIGVTEMVPKNYKLQTQEVELGTGKLQVFCKSEICEKRGVYLHARVTKSHRMQRND